MVGKQNMWSMTIFEVLDSFCPFFINEADIRNKLKDPL